MIAKIVDRDRREYYSAVFAVCEKGWNTAVIVYDDERRCFSFVKMFRYVKNPVRSVFIIDSDETDFVKEKSIKVGFLKTIKHINGYDWLVENSELFIKILNNKQVDEYYKEIATKINAGISLNEWTFVKNERDIKNLMLTAIDFHDGSIEKILFNNENDSLEVIFSGCWGSKIILLFQSEIALHLSNCSTFQPIMDSNVFLKTGLFIGRMIATLKANRI